MTSMAFPTSPATSARPTGGKGWYVWPAVSLIVLVGLAALWGARRMSGGRNNVIASGKFYTVSPTDLDIKFRKDGELQAVNNVDVLCMVEGRSTMVYLVKEGE